MKRERWGQGVVGVFGFGVGVAVGGDPRFTKFDPDSDSDPEARGGALG